MGESKNTAKPAEVKVCKCKHEGQDQLHGKQQRVHNPTAKGLKCTVCGDVKQYSK